MIIPPGSFFSAIPFTFFVFPPPSVSLFAWEYNSSNVSMTPALINTLSMTLLALVISVPFGVFAAIYLVEYAKRGSWLVRLIRMTAETLSGIPSIIYGLFGLLFFVSYLGYYEIGRASCRERV